MSKQWDFKIFRNYYSWSNERHLDHIATVEADNFEQAVKMANNHAKRLIEEEDGEYFFVAEPIAKNPRVFLK